MMASGCTDCSKAGACATTSSIRRACRSIVARRVKSDRIDTGKLLRSLMACLRGEPKVWSVVRVPTIAEEDDRLLHRERARLLNERIQHVNRINGLLAIHGVYDYEPMHPERMQRLQQLRTADRCKLPPRLQAELSASCSG